MRTHISADFGRFLIAGFANTALTSAIYFMGLLVFTPTVAYAIAWLIGIAFVMFIYPERVFIGSNATVCRRGVLGLTIASVFFLGEAVLTLVVSVTHHPGIAFAVALATTFIVNFGLSRYLLRTVGGNNEG